MASERDPIIHFDRLSLEQSAPELPLGIQEFQNAVYSCLVFALGEPFPRKTTTPVKAILSQLADRFFAEVYVPRPLAAELKASIRNERLVVLRGYRGSGKTTLLRWLAYDDAQTTTHSTIYLDLGEHAATLGVRTDRLRADAPPRETVSSVVYKALRRRLIHNLDGPFTPQQADANRAKWAAFRIREHTHYDPLKEYVLERYGPSSLEEWTKVLAIPEVDTLRRTAYETACPRPDLEDLKLLGRFLREELHHHPIVLIDNLDRFPTAIQREVVHYALDFSGESAVLTPVLSVRNTNFGRLLPQSDDDRAFLISTVKDLSEQDNAAVVKEFLRKRLEFLLTLDTEVVFGGESISRLATHYGFQGSSTAFIDAHTGLLEHVTRDLLDETIIGMFSEWHNQSLRGTAIRAFSLIHALLCGRDPLFAYDSIIRHIGGKDDPKIFTHNLRTAIYRHVVLGPQLTREGPPAATMAPASRDALGAPNLFTDRDSQEGANPVYFVRLKILEALATAEKLPVTYEQIAELLGSIGVSRDLLKRAVLALRAEPAELVMVDLPINLGSKQIGTALRDFPDEVDIDLLPAGRFAIKTLAPSCEYVFWTAMVTPVSRSYFRSCGVQDARSDSMRARVAAEFLATHLMPRFIREVQWCLDNAADPVVAKQVQNHRRVLAGKGAHMPFPDRAIQQIGSFIAKASDRYSQSLANAKAADFLKQAEADWRALVNRVVQ